MKVTIHQPNFWPWIGFFDKITKADLFISLDSVPFTKGGYQNRVQVKGPQGPQWLTVPVVTRGRLGQATCDVEIDVTQKWRHTNRQTLMSLYRKAPHFHEIWEAISPIYEQEWSRLAEFNMAGISSLCDLLSIRKPMISSSTLNNEGSSSELLASLIAQVGGTTYISGPSGSNYLDLEPFTRRNIAVEFHEFSIVPYAQLFGDFSGGLSILDYCMNAGVTTMPWSEP